MRYFIFLTLFSLSLFNGCQDKKEISSLIPAPKIIENLNDEFTISENTVIDFSNNKLSEYFIQQIHSLTGIKISQLQNGNIGNKIIITQDDSSPINDKESYRLKVTGNNIELKSATEEGIFRGMQTILQLIPASNKANKNSSSFSIQACNIVDEAAFEWRGLNLDCGRHFMDKDFIKRYIDILAYYKFNTFHWHLTEDQGWRIEIKKYPKLTEIGGWRKEPGDSIYGGFYTQEDIKEIVEYAGDRFINIVPEIEMPGHSLASLASYPENSCTGGPFEVTNIWGVHKDIYCAGKEETFIFLQNILDEVIELFPGKYIHIGGDEAPKDRWKECKDCQARIKSENLKNEHELQSYFIKRIAKYLNSKGKEIIGWDEILEGGLAKGAIVQSWQSFQGAVEAAKHGNKTICSPNSHTYLNHSAEDMDLRIAYSFNPIPNELVGDEKNLVIGSEVNLWTEHAPQETVDSKLFPRILALAEVFWRNPNSDENGSDYDDFYSRVQNHYRDLEARDIKYGRESKIFSPKSSYDKSKNEFKVEVIQGQKDIKICYTTDGKEPTHNSQKYDEPIIVNNSTVIQVSAFKNNQKIGKTSLLQFEFHKGINSKLDLQNAYDERYRAGGENSLIDGIRGTDNFHDGNWQGYEGKDLIAVLDLGTEQNLSKVETSFFFDSNSYIFLPKNVEISFSLDGRNYFDAKEIKNEIPEKSSEILIKNFDATFENVEARFIKIKAESNKICPDWHPGAGAPTWMFIDEIVVK